MAILSTDVESEGQSHERITVQEQTGVPAQNLGGGGTVGMTGQEFGKLPHHLTHCGDQPC